MNTDNENSAKNFARMRRAMLSQAGKSANVSVASYKASAKTVASVSAQPVVHASVDSVAADADTGMSVREVNRLRRQALSTGGKSAVAQANKMAKQKAYTPAPVVEASSSVQSDSDRMNVHVISAENHHQVLPCQSKGRMIAMARRQAMASSGKTGANKVAQAAKLSQVMSHESFNSLVDKGVSGRQMAMMRRAMLSSQGAEKSSGNAATRPSGKVRPKKELPTKVEFTHTLSGHLVSGTRVDVNKGITGSERGECRNVTGTEYLSGDHFSQVCMTKPEAAPAKVAEVTTTANQKVTGVVPAPSDKLTGSETGACRAITGSEYWGPDFYSATGCATKPAAPARKVNDLSSCSGNQRVTGVEVAQGNRVTGGDVGLGKSITGSCFTSQTQVMTKQPPAKVQQTHTSRQSLVTSSIPTSSSAVTGSGFGSCKAITGSEYLSAEDFQKACHTDMPVVGHQKVMVGRSEGKMTVTGQLVDDALGRVTGNEQRAKNVVTGSQYHDRQEAKLKGGVSTIKRANASLIRAVNAIVPAQNEGASCPKNEGDGQDSVLSVTGHSYAESKHLSGTRGQCQAVTGDAPEVTDLMANYCRNHPIKLVSKPDVVVKPNCSVAPEQKDGGNEPAMNDICVPYRSLNSQSRLTGNAVFDDRISTGAGQMNVNRQSSHQRMIPGSMAQTMKLIKDQQAANAPIAPCPVEQAPEAEVVVQPHRAVSKLTGDGSQQGVVISGDAWADSRHVTGTEGQSSRARNITEKGNARSWTTGAQHFKQAEKPQRETSVKITGSSGHPVTKGPSVTYSGGARG